MIRKKSVSSRSKIQEGMKKITPVLLLTGYLGSGKTTLLNRILANHEGIKFAVIVNDIGEVNIDASLIEKGGVVGRKDESLVALQNGCICCTLKMDLVNQLLEIVRMDKFDYIVIEASGVCEPEPIARTICSIPYMGPEYTKDGVPMLDCIVTVVDALRMKDEFGCAKDLLRGTIAEEDIENLVIQQIEFCNVVLLNKASEVTPEELARIKTIVRTLQPQAEIKECDYGEIELSEILSTALFDYDSVAASAAWISKVEGAIEEDEDLDDDDDDDDDDEHEHHHHDDHDEHDDEHEHHHHDEHDDEHEHGHHHHHHHHHDGEGDSDEYGIGTYVYYARKPFDINKFDAFVAKHWPNGIIRAKGICYFSDEKDNCYLFEQAGSQISMKNAGEWFACMPEEQLQAALATDSNLARDWDAEYGDRMQKLVFIGQNLDKAAIKKALDFCLDA